VIVAERAESAGVIPRVVAWGRSHLPTHASIEANRFLRPVAHRILVPSLWRFTRRSVPRGVALGIMAGILFPFAHMALAAVLALPLRANVPTAVGTTLINNPITFVPLLAAAYKVGHWVLRLDQVVPGAPIATNVHEHAGWLHWLVSQGGPATIVGLVVIATIASAAGYVATAFLWRWRMGYKWRTRHGRG